MSPQGFAVTPRDQTIKQLRMIANDLEKGCGGFRFLVGVDLSSSPDMTGYGDFDPERR